MYNTHFKRWGPAFDKNKKKGRSGNPVGPSNGKRVRAKVLHQPKSPQVPETPRPILPAFTPRIYRKTEVTLISVGNYTDLLLRALTWNSFSIIPSHTASSLPPTWKDISDQIWGATQLMVNGSMEKGGAALRRSFDSLWRSGVIRNNDPAIMVKFWRICYRLNKVDGSIRSSCEADETATLSVLKSFLDYMRGLAEIHAIEEKGVKQLPLLQLLDAVSRTSTDRLQDTFEVAYRRTIDVMESRLGRQHLTVLEMRSNYLKYWANEPLARSIFMESYPVILDTAEREYGPTGEPTLRALHDFVYALYYNVNDRALTARIARNAYKRARKAPGVQERPQWGIAAQTFAFTAKLLAMISLEDCRFEDCRNYLEEAIVRLGLGDRQCCTRALMLGDILQNRLLEWGRLDEAAYWSDQKVLIGRRIDNWESAQ